MPPTTVAPIQSLGVADAVVNSGIFTAILADFLQILPAAAMVSFTFAGTIRLVRFVKGSIKR